MTKRGIRLPAALIALGLVIGIGAFLGPASGIASAATPCDGTSWLNFGGGTWSCDGAGGVYGSTTSGDAMLLSAGAYGDFVLGANVTNTTSNADFVFHMQDMSNGYILRFIPQGSPSQYAGIWLSKRIGGIETSLGYFPGGPSIGQAASFVIVGSGSTYSITLNGVALGSFVDATFPSGAAGFIVSGDGGYGDAATFANDYVNAGAAAVYAPVFSPYTYACPDGYSWSQAQDCFQVIDQRFFCPDGHMYDGQGNYWNNDGSWAGMQNDFRGCFDANVFNNNHSDYDDHSHDMNDPHSGQGNGGMGNGGMGNGGNNGYPWSHTGNGNGGANGNNGPWNGNNGDDVHQHDNNGNAGTTVVSTTTTTLATRPLAQTPR